MNSREARILGLSNVDFKRQHSDGVDPLPKGALSLNTLPSFPTTRNRGNASNSPPAHPASPDEQDPRNIAMLRVWFGKKEMDPEPSIPGHHSPNEKPATSNTPPPQGISSIASSPTIPSANSTATVTATTTTTTIQSQSPTSPPNGSEEIHRLKLELRTSQIKYIQANSERKRLQATIEYLERELVNVYSTVEEEIGVPGYNLEKLRSMEGEIKALCKAYLRVDGEKEELIKENKSLKDEVEDLTRTIELEATARELSEDSDRGKYREQDVQIQYMAALIERQSAELLRLNNKHLEN